MQKPAITLETPIAEIMQEWPETIQVFLDHHMICVGCQMSAFDTLADAVAYYGYSAEEFLHKLNIVIPGTE